MAKETHDGCSLDPAGALWLEALFEHVRPTLQDHGDTDVVMAFLRRLAARGGGAERQRASAKRHGALTGVVDDLVALTAAAPRQSVRG
jgi:carboxylate-amine ligase